MSTRTRFRGALREGADGEHIERLAALAGREPPEGAVLLAEVEGDPVAAIGVFDGRAVADSSRAGITLRMRLHLLRLQLRVTVALTGL
jgi:hypothetical protein